MPLPPSDKVKTAW